MRRTRWLGLWLAIWLAALPSLSGCLLDWTPPSADAGDRASDARVSIDARPTDARDAGAVLDATDGSSVDTGVSEVGVPVGVDAGGAEMGDAGMVRDVAPGGSDGRDTRDAGCATCGEAGGTADLVHGDATTDAAQTSPLTLATKSLPAASVGVRYAFTPSASGGALPYAWSVTSGALPAGLGLNASSGAITGTPTAVGTATFILQVMDAAMQTAARSLTLVVGNPLSLTTTSLPTGTVGASYAATLTASGGTEPYQWSVSSGSLPAGLTLSPSTGSIAGVPSVAGDLSFTVTVADSNGLTAGASLTLAITASLVIETASLPNGKEGSAYSTTLAASGGKSPLGWAVASGSLPAGLVLDATSGLLHGTPAAGSGGSYPFSVTVTDASSPKQSASASLTLRIVGPLAITTTSLASATVGTPYQATLQATGGTTPYVWTRASGNLPAGLSLSQAGVLQGTPTAAGSYTFTVTVQDATSTTVQRQLTLVVLSPLAVETTTLASGTQGQAYAATLTATGGTGTYHWAIKSGALPSGISLGATSGKLSGTPTQAGTFTFVVTVSDGNNDQADSATLSLTIIAPLTIVTTSLPNATRGATYSATLQASGGVTPYTWSVSAGALPRTLSLQADTGVISGTVSTRIVASANRFTVQVTDSSTPAQQKTAQLTITVQ